MKNTTEALKVALDALKANHEHHATYDEHDGYPESELCGQNMAAIAALSALSASTNSAEPQPVLYQCRMRPMWGNVDDNWTDWTECTADSYADYVKTPVLHNWKYEVRKLYSAPQASDSSHPIGYFHKHKYGERDLIEHVVDSAAGEEGVFPLYSHPVDDGSLAALSAMLQKEVDRLIASQPVSALTDEQIVQLSLDFPSWHDDKGQFLAFCRALLSATSQPSEAEKVNADLVKTLESVVRQAEPILAQNGIGMGCFNRARRVIEKACALRQQAPAVQEEGLLSEIRALAECGVSHGLLADDYCSQIVAKIEAASHPAPAQTGEKTK